MVTTARCRQPEEPTAVTPEERARFEQRMADRQAVLAKFPDPAAPISDEECKFLTGEEITSLINAGRIPGVGPDKRLARR
jgi:hypothetical protein